MQAFTTLHAIAAPLPIINVDTDMIIPKEYLKTIKRTGLGKNLFDEMRYDTQGKERPGFILNQPAYRTAGILVAGENFGCGSSREHAPWALMDFGIRCIIAPSFADIFFNNCFKNGILPIRLPQASVDILMEETKSQDPKVNVDLSSQKVTSPSGKVFSFDIDPFQKHCLIKGLDDIALTLEKEKDILAFETTYQKHLPWLFLQV